MEEYTDCRCTSSLCLTDASDCAASSTSAPPSSSSSTSSDDLSLKKERRFYRIQYLRSKRLRAKGYKVPLPTKTWQVPEQRIVAVPTAETILSKENLRRIKNRESAERSRKAINDSIEEAQRCIFHAKQENYALQAERMFLMQQMAQIVSNNGHQQFIQCNSVQMQENWGYSMGMCDFDGESNSVISDTLSDLTPDDVSEPSFDLLDFDINLTEEALETLLANL